MACLPTQFTVVSRQLIVERGECFIRFKPDVKYPICDPLDPSHECLSLFEASENALSIDVIYGKSVEDSLAYQAKAFVKRPKKLINARDVFGAEAYSGVVRVVADECELSREASAYVSPKGKSLNAKRLFKKSSSHEFKKEYDPCALRHIVFGEYAPSSKESHEDLISRVFGS